MRENSKEKNKMVSKIKSSDIITLLIILSLLFISLLGSHALLNPDEGRYSEITREMLVRGDYITPYLNGIVFLDKPILFYLLEIISIKLFGLQEWSLRLWPALFGIFGCLMLYISGCLLFNRRTGIISALILASTTLYFLSAHYINTDLEVAVLITAALLSFLIAEGQNKNKTKILFLFLAYGFSGLAILTKGLIGIVIPALVICSWGICLKRWKLLGEIYLLRGLLLIFLIAAPWYIIEQYVTPEFFHYFFVTQHVSRFLTNNFNGQQSFWFYIPIILIGFFPWTVFLFQALIKKISCIYKNPKNYSNDLFLLIWTLVILLFFSFPSSKIIGYILPIFPPLALLIGSYLDSVWDKKWRSGILAFIVLSFFMGFSIIILIFLSGQHIVSNNYSIQVTLPRLQMAKYYFFTIALVFIFLASISFLMLKKKAILYPLINIFIASICLLFIFLLAIPKINLLSTKPLAVKLLTYLKPDQSVIVYHQYYQDLPFYLQRNILVADQWDAINIPKTDNWRRELWEGSHYKNSQSWLITDKDLEKYLTPDHPRIFLFTDPLSFIGLKKLKYKLYEIDRVDNVLLLSNRKK